MKKVLVLSNIPAPYRIDFYNELGKYCDLTVVFEARRAPGIRFNWNDGNALNFHAVFLSDGEIDEVHVDRRIFPFIRRGAYDHVIATNYGYLTETAALVKMRLLGIPYDLEIDGGVVRPGESAAKRLLKRFIIRGAKTLFSSGAQTDALYLHYGAEQKRIVRSPFSSLHECDLAASAADAEERRAVRARLGVTERHMVLSVGQYIPRKGFDLLLEHADGFLPDTGIYIIGGDGVPRPEYVEIVNRKRLCGVHFLPFMDAARLTEFYRAADVFVLATREDMWGLVINEALANALPVVTTTVCNAGMELINDGINGYLLDLSAFELLPERVNAVLSDELLRARMAQAALSKIRPYTIEGMTQVHRNVIG